MGKKISLGRGLDTIFSDNAIEETGGVREVRISQIEPKADQPRKQFEESTLEELADSIRTHGIIQPILVRELENGNYQIIAGERRWRAARIAGLDVAPVLVVEADDFKAAQLALIENLQREDLNVLEEARAYEAMMADYGMTQEEVAERIGKSRPYVSNAIRLLDLPTAVTELLEDGALTAGHARALLGLRDKSQAESLAKRIVYHRLSVREAEAAVKNLNRQKKTQQPVSDRTVPDYLADLEKRATGLSGRLIRITAGRKKQVVVEYQDNEDLENLLVALCGREIKE